jgi:excisionase family DNA binding protein
MGGVMDRPEDPPSTVWVTVAEAAEKSGVGTSTVRQWYRSGRIPTQRAEGERGAFLVPLDAVMALADRADEEGDDLGAAVIDLNASYWSAQTEAAREEAAEAKREVAAVRADLAEAESELDEFEKDLAQAREERDQALEELAGLRSAAAATAADHDERTATLHAATVERDRLEIANQELRDELAGVRAELGSATAEIETFQARIGLLQEELTTLRAVTAKAGSITDNSWLDQPTNSYRSPVRPQGMAAAEALSGLLASTQPDLTGSPSPDSTSSSPMSTSTTPPKTIFDDVHRRQAAARQPTFDEPADDAGVDENEAGAEGPADRIDDEQWAEQRRIAARDFGFGDHDDDLLPEPEKKSRRGRK